MRTRTIFQAYKKAARDTLYSEEWRQAETFERELLRRMDERDALVAESHKPPHIKIHAVKVGGQSVPIDMPVGWKEFEI